MLFRCFSWLILLRFFGLVSIQAEPIRFSSAVANGYAGEHRSFLKVIDGVETGPEGWNPTPTSREPRSLIVQSAQPVEAAELDVSLFFLAGRPFNYLAEFTLSFTTDETPSIGGRWQPLEILRFNSQAATLRRISSSGLRAEQIPYNVNGAVPDEIYRLTAVLPGGRATGFRLDALPVPLTPDGRDVGLSWYEPNDFTLTEFRVAVHQPETTNIALYQPVRTSHPLYMNPDRNRMRPEALTDGLPATIAHPDLLPPGTAFFFEIDLGRVLDLDHIGLRNRGDERAERFWRVAVDLYDAQPDQGMEPTWRGMACKDGKHLALGEVEILRRHDGLGRFRGRYLRISSDNALPFSPQLAEVEVYQTRTPKVIAARADGRALPLVPVIEVPPGARRLSLDFRIPQPGRPAVNVFRWRVRGEMQDWENARLWTIDLACPPSGRQVIEAQAIHSNGQLDASILELPLLIHQYWWEKTWVQWTAGWCMIGLAIGIGTLWSRHRAARQLAWLRAETALAAERTRIARDMHDEVGGKLARLAMLGDLALQPGATTTHPLATITRGVREVAAELEQVIWSLNPKHDCIEDLVRHIYQYAEEFFSDTPVRCRFGSMFQIPSDVHLAPETRNALFRSFKEAVTNVLKHAHAQAVEIDVTWQADTLTVCIADDGCGFTPANAPCSGDGNGLTNMRERMAAIHGSCTIDSNAQGTTVWLRWRRSP